jgi:hypothetical protein
MSMAVVLVATDTGIVPFIDGAPGPRELDGHAVRHLARGRAEVLAVVDERVVARRTAEGAWSDVATAPTDLACLLPTPDGAWCGTADGHLLRLRGGAFAPVTGFDAVAGRDTWHAVPSGDPYVRSLSVTADDRALLAGVHVGGIPRSGNGGSSWKPTIDVEADVHQVRADPGDPRLVLAPAGYGLAVSRDAGVTWAITTDGMHAGYSRAVAFITDAALVSVSDGPRGGRSAIYRWDVTAGGPLTKVEDGLPEWLDGNVDTGTLDAHRETAAFADAGGTVYVSADGGRSFTTLGSDLGPVHAICVNA